MATSTDPPLLRLCRPTQNLLEANGAVARRIEKALIDLAMGTIAVRRSHRVHFREDLEYAYHYTSAQTFAAIFPDPVPDPFERPRLLLSPTDLLNDPNEGAYFFSHLESGANELERLGPELQLHRQVTRVQEGLSATDPLVFVASLCLEQDNLNLWRFYGGAMGVSFGVHRSQFDLTSEEGLEEDYSRGDKLYRVKYGQTAIVNSLSHLRPAIFNLVALHQSQDPEFKAYIVRAMAGLLGSIAYLFKDESYEAEKECRLLRILSIKDMRATPDWKAIGGIIRSQSNVEFIHGGGEPPHVTLGPQFDVNNPERGQTRVIDRIRAAINDREPVIRLSKQKYRAS